MYKIYVAAVEPLMEEEFYQKALSMVGNDRQEKIKKLLRRGDQARSAAAGLLFRYALEEWTKERAADGKGAGNDQLGQDGKSLGKYGSGWNGKETGICRLEQNGGGTENRWSVQDGERSGKHRSAQDAYVWDGSCIIGEHGKPMLPKESGFYFNLSHSGDYALCAVSDREIGADIQRHEKYADRLAERFFHPEELAYLKEAKDSKRCFYDIWCLKESCIKCTGRGLSTGLEKFSVVPFFYGEGITLDSVRCVGESAPAYTQVDLKELGETDRKKAVEGYSMGVVELAETAFDEE